MALWNLEGRMVALPRQTVKPGTHLCTVLALLVDVKGLFGKYEDAVEAHLGLRAFLARHFPEIMSTRMTSRQKT
jgi:hypothetical protein